MITINEITFGSLYGGYRDRNGNVVSNTQLSQNLNPITPSQQEAINRRNPFLKGVNTSDFKGSRYYAWQKEVIEALEGGKDVYVVAPPGGGKTTPLMAYYLVNLLYHITGEHRAIRSLTNLDITNEAQPLLSLSGGFAENYAILWNDIFLRILNPIHKNTPKCLFIVPIRILSDEQAKAFQEYLLEMLLFLRSLFTTGFNYIYEHRADPTITPIWVAWNQYNTVATGHMNGNDWTPPAWLDEDHPRRQPRQITLQNFCDVLRQYNAAPFRTLFKFMELFLRQLEIEPAIQQELNCNDVDTFFEKFLAVDVATPDPARYNTPELVRQFTEREYPTHAENHHNKIAKAFMNFVAKRMISVKNGGGSGDFANNPQDTIITVATSGSAINFISSIKDKVKFIVYDEAHLYMPSEFNSKSQISQADAIQRAKEAVTIIQQACSNEQLQLAFLSGTINPDSADNFIRFLRLKYNRTRFERVPKKVDTNAGNKTPIKVVPFDKLLDTRQTEKLIRDIIRRNERNVAFIYFSKKIMLDIVNNVIKELSSRTQTSQVSRVDESERRALRRRVFVDHPTWTDAQINAEVEAILSGRNRSYERDVKSLFKDPEMAEIENKHLRNAVQHGIGYIFRADKDDPNTHPDLLKTSEKDKQIVAKLFTSGKINVLLASPAIGIGVNLTIRDMYIQTLEKQQQIASDPFKKGDKFPEADRELSQLFNRAGRGKFQNSTIYTPSENVARIQNIIALKITDYNFVPAINVEPGQQFIDFLMKLNAASSAVVNLVQLNDYRISQRQNPISFIVSEFNRFRNELFKKER